MSHPGAPDRIIVGRIATLAGRAGFGWVEAIAIHGGRVTAAGPAGAILAQAGPATQVWQLGPARVALPGIVDAHLHLASFAAVRRTLDLSGARDLATALAVIAAEHDRRSAGGDRDGWLMGHGWSLDGFGRRPDAAMLEGVAPGRPVALWSHDHHARWVSPAALAVAGIDRTSPDPRGGHIARMADGSPDGVLLEDAATLVDRAIPPLDPALLEADLTLAAAELARLGVVAAHDPGEVSPDAGLVRGPTLFRRLAEEGRLPLRVVASVREHQLGRAIDLGFRSGRDAPGGRYRDGWLKLFADGSLGSRSAALLTPYEEGDAGGPPVGGPSGMLLRSPEALLAAAARAVGAGIAVQVHGIGDAAVRLALDVLATIPAVAAMPHRIEHAQLVDPADVPRFAGLGVVASVQPCHLIGDAPAARAAWGARTADAFPLGALQGASAHLAFGTDAPVEPADPWPGIAIAVTRRSDRWPPDADAFHAEQAVDLAAAIRAATLGAARSAGAADEGHLGLGARADLIVVDAAVVDETPRPGGSLERCRPLATLIDGEPAWQDAAFDP